MAKQLLQLPGGHAVTSSMLSSGLMSSDVPGQHWPHNNSFSTLVSSLKSGLHGGDLHVLYVAQDCVVQHASRGQYLGSPTVMSALNGGQIIDCVSLLASLASLTSHQDCRPARPIVIATLPYGFEAVLLIQRQSCHVRGLHFKDCNSMRTGAEVPGSEVGG